MQKKAYSYIRFSTPEQIKGDSLRRQLESSRQWAEENGYELDTSMRDLGVSAYSGANRTEGSLKRFISLIEQGHIDEGSVLVVESLDRLSREEITKSLTQFINILSAGIKIVTLADRQEYTADSINNISQLVMSLFSMARAHEESLMKSIRVRASWKAKVANAHNKKLSRFCPNWLQYNEETDSFDLIEERADLIRDIFCKSIAGMGQDRLAKELNEKKIPSWGRANGWHQTYLQKLFQNRALLGEFQPYSHHNGIRTPLGDPITDYFPAVLESDVFHAAQTARKKRTQTRGRRGTKFSNILQGMCYCFHCGGTMRYLKNPYKDKEYRYLTCSHAKRKLGCSHHKYYPYQQIEALVLMTVAEQVDWFSVVAGVKTNLSEMKRKQASLSSQLADSESRASRYAGLFEVASGDALDLAQERYLKILDEQAEIRNELTIIEGKITEHTMPDAGAIHAKIEHAIERLRKEEDPHELFELRATINAALRDSVKLSFGGHEDNEFSVSYSINDGIEEVMVDGDEPMKLMGEFAVGHEKIQMMNFKEDQLELEREKKGIQPKVVSLDDLNPQNVKAIMDSMPEPFKFEPTVCKELS
ncbi:MAG: recombinase family protein [Mariprofundaceae bacterium]